MQDRIHTQPIRELSIWRAVLKEQCCRTPINHFRCIWRAQNKQRQSRTTNLTDTLDDYYSDAPEGILLSLIQIHTDNTELIILNYTMGTIMLQDRTSRRWADHESECHKLIVKATDKLRPCSSNTMDDSDTASADNGGATATAAITAGRPTPKTSDNSDNVVSAADSD